jgi:hypothetical protein
MATLWSNCPQRMTKSKTLLLTSIILMVVGFFTLRYMRDFTRVKNIEVGSTPFEPGIASKVVFTNTSSSKVEFLVECYGKIKAGGNPIFTTTISMPPKQSIEFDVNPELAGRELPRIIGNKGCEALWRGPFQIKRSAWWLHWEYSKPTYKVEYP